MTMSHFREIFYEQLVLHFTRKYANSKRLKHCPNEKSLTKQRPKRQQLAKLLLLLLLGLFVTHKIPPRRLHMRSPAVRKCSCLYTMYHINNILSCPKGRETSVSHSQRTGQAIPHRRSRYSKASISIACVCPWNS